VRLFPGSRILTERAIALAKSFVVLDGWDAETLRSASLDGGGE
jgi:hypothetical protein